MATPVYTSTGTTGEGQRRRMLRGVELYRAKSADFCIYLSGEIGVPSASRTDHVHHTDVEHGTCTCEDYAYRGCLCLHYFAALCFVARRNCRAAVPARASRCQRLASVAVRRAA